MRLLSILLFGVTLTTAQVSFTTETDRVRIQIDGKPYSDFIMKSDDAMKPYLYPLRAASGTIVTRHWPMETVAEIEPKDHPHQRGVWFGPDDVNGFDFWNNESSYKTPKRGRMTLVKVSSEVKNAKKIGSIYATFDWFDPNGPKLVQESSVMTFRTDPKLRIIDFEFTLTAATQVTFGDGKDCCFGIRMAAALQEDRTIKERGKPNVTIPGEPGVISNADGGEHEKAVWGKPSNWADYSGEINGEKLGITIMDHPSNSRRARWHERAYGLFAANPFGLSAFTGDKSQDGSVKLAPGESLHFRYRVIVHPGDSKSAGIAKLWDEYAK